MKNRRLRVFWIGAFLAATHVFAAGRYPLTIPLDYQGRFASIEQTQRERVRLLARQAQLEISYKLGLIQYRDGFQYPVVIRFEDSAPEGIENALAFVRLSQSGFDFFQDLVVNLDAFSQDANDFDAVFYHEMTHVVVNDAVGAGASAKLPHWVQEGLAIYMAGDGEKRVRALASHFQKSDRKRLVVDLEGPYTGLAYPQYYLAMKFILDRRGINAFQGFVRNLVQGRTPAEAIFDVMQLDWTTFKSQLAAYSLQQYQSV